ncbi:MAG TPA: Rv3235 family protein [Microlunatus sp.]|nr:Rv3235 family protein [Microlunatus sp.]
MSAPPLALRPAIDARPPAQSWSDRSVSDPPPPDQPPLQFVEPVDLVGAPTRTPSGALVAVDTVPAGVDPARRRELEDLARTWAPWFAQLLAEALDGRRPLEALGHWLDEWVLAEVSRRVRVQRRARQRIAPTASRPPGTFISLRTQFSHPLVLEVAAHVRRDRRSTAWAFQLRLVGDRWRCTALELRD